MFHTSFRPLDNSDSTVANGQVNVYEVGTTTAKTVYKDPWKIASYGSQPIVLDANGEAPIYYDGAAKIVLKTSGGSTIWTKDSVTCNRELKTTVPAGNVDNWYMGVLNDPVNVKTYGAMGDGSHDDATAIQKAIDDNPGAVILFPSGTYKIGTKLTPKPGQKFFGYGATIKTDAASYVPYAFHVQSGVDEGDGCEFHGLTFEEATPTSSNSSIAIGMEDCNDVVINDCVAKGYTQYGFSIKAESETISNPRVTNCRVIDHAQKGSIYAIGILLYSPADDSGYDSHGGVVTGNQVFIKDSTDADGACCKVENFRDCVISNNMFVRPAVTGASGSGALTLIGLRDSAITGNTIKSEVDDETYGKLAAVSISSNARVSSINPTVSTTQSSYNVLFSDNNLSGVADPDPGDETGALVLTGDLTNIKISNNVIQAQVDLVYTSETVTNPSVGKLYTMETDFNNISITDNSIGTYLKCTGHQIDTLNIKGNTINNQVSIEPDSSTTPNVNTVQIMDNIILLKDGEQIRLHGTLTRFVRNTVIKKGTLKTGQNELISIGDDNVIITDNTFNCGSATPWLATLTSDAQNARVHKNHVRGPFDGLGPTTAKRLVNFSSGGTFTDRLNTGDTMSGKITSFQPGGPGGLVAGAGVKSSAISVTLARVGDIVHVSPGTDLKGCVATGYVQSTGNVIIRVQNGTPNTQGFLPKTWWVQVTTFQDETT
ncbi:MAG: hypothetical protein HQL52_18155 [Magnetococcales bacterium]|nr:hypothetical protein [Magnetococcales bacterium]